MPRLPALDITAKVNHSLHLVILGAGASRAAVPNGDAYGRRLPVMQDFVETVGLAPLLDRAGKPWRSRNFEDVFDDLYREDPNALILSEIEMRIRTYFRSLQLPPEITVYDRLLLSLREKDLIATFNWDPLLLQAYQRNSSIRRLPQVAFLHGNVYLGICVSCRVKGILGAFCAKCGEPLSESRLLYPVRDKGYATDQFIAAEWDGLRHILERAYFLTIFGYSAPRTDAAAIEIMRTAWAKNQTQVLAQIEIIDIRPREELLATWEPFIVRQHYGISNRIEESYLAAHPRRTCEALAFATLQQEPWHDNWIPQLRSPEELRAWINPLLEEEAGLEKRNEPLSGKPFPQP